MKGFLLALCFISLAVALCATEEQPAKSPFSLDSYKLDFELGYGLGMASDCETGRFWKSKGNSTFGVNLIYPATENIQLRSGISGQAFYAKRVVVHPYPYVMDMDVNLSTYAIRAMLIGDWVFPKKEEKTEKFFGIGMYTDLMLDAKARIWQHYLTHTPYEVVDLKDSFDTFIPGIILCTGHQFTKVRVELRYTLDLARFSIPGNGVGKQRRSTIGLNFGLHN